MSRKLFRNSVATLAIVAGLGGAALAQTATTTTDTAPAPAATDMNAPMTADTLPDALKALNLQNIDIDRERRHTSVEGTLADGTQIEADVDRNGQLRKIEADDDATLPAAVIEAFVPQSVRDSETFAQFASIEEIGIPPADAPVAGVMIKGEDANGEDLRAGFAEDGTLVRFGRGDDDDRRDHGKKKGKRGHDGHDHGARGGPDAANNRPMPPAPEPLSESAVTAILGAAGYADMGDVMQDGPRTMVEAVNAAGEDVTVEISPRGDVVRETAR